MGKDQKRRMSGRTMLKLGAAAAIFVVGLLIGGGIADGDGECSAPSAGIGAAR